MTCGDVSPFRTWPVRRLVLSALFLSLLVGNPFSRCAAMPFMIVAGQAPTAPAPGSVEPSKPAAPETPQAPSAPAAPGAPAEPTSPAAPPAPEVTTVEPAQVGPAVNIDLRITGKNFAPGAKVSFSNPGVRVLKISSPSSTELIVHIKVAFDATPSVASLFVVNPDDNEVEAPFEVTAKPAAKPAAPYVPAPPPAPDTSDTRSYDAFHLGSPTEVFHTHGKVKGALVVSPGTIQYQEDQKILINLSMTEIREIKVSSIATATFHITLNSGKTYHFAPGSLRPSDARHLVDSLSAAMAQ